MIFNCFERSALRTGELYVFPSVSALPAKTLFISKRFALRAKKNAKAFTRLRRFRRRNYASRGWCNLLDSQMFFAHRARRLCIFPSVPRSARKINVRSFKRRNCMCCLALRASRGRIVCIFVRFGASREEVICLPERSPLRAEEAEKEIHNTIKKVFGASCNGVNRLRAGRRATPSKYILSRTDANLFKARKRSK